MTGVNIRRAKNFLGAIVLTTLLVTIFYWQSADDIAVTSNSIQEKLVYKSDVNLTRNSELIFIGGMPRSGTTLMRAMLDAHPHVRCGQETRVVPRILQMRQHWMKSAKETMRLNEAGVTTEVLNSAVSAFILEIIAGHGEMAPRLCNKDPLTMKYSDYIVQLFPNAKFLFMVRDGRATVHSIISRKVSITGFDLNNYEQCLKRWNDAMRTMFNKCLSIGASKCMIVYYEQLVMHPQSWLMKILQFLDLPWNDAVLHHDRLINKPGGIKLSKVEKSSDQVIKPVNLEGLTKWVGHFPEDVLKKADKIAPMLKELGYDPSDYSPDYGQYTNGILENGKNWRNKSENVFYVSENLENNNEGKLNNEIAK